MSTDPVEFIRRPSLVMNGIEATLEASIQEAQARFPDRELCVVSEWIWIDFQGSFSMIEGLASRGVRPSILLAVKVLHDSQDRFRAGRGVRTSLLVRYEGPGYFVTRNTVYVMLGTGRRVQRAYRGDYLI